MARMKLSEAPVDVNQPIMDDAELMEQFANNTEMARVAKKAADEYKDRVKDILRTCPDDGRGHQSYSAGQFVIILSNREKAVPDEVKMMLAIKSHMEPEEIAGYGLIKTREYVDMDALEAYLSSHVNSETADLRTCINNAITVTSTEVVTVKRKKEGKE